MAIAPTSNPLAIVEAARVNGVTTLRVVGHGFTNVHVGQPLTVVRVGAGGPGDEGFNGIFTVSAVPDANTIQYLQTGKRDVHAGVSGGACAVG